jgi:hypothetical protein
MTKRESAVERRIREIGSDWIGEQVVRLGNYSEQVSTGIPGQYYARQGNGRVITIVNSISTAPRFDKRVLVRRSKVQPTIWKIAEVLEDYLEPIDAGQVAYHHEQHEEDGPDRLVLDRKQIKQLSARAAGAFTVQVFGGAVQTSGGVVFVNNELLNLASYVITSGAKYISIESDEAGDLSLNEGTVFPAPNVGTYSDIPTPGTGNHPIAYVLLFGGQTAIIDNNIRPILPLPGASSTVLFNDAEGDPEDVSTSASSDGSSDFAARRDHVHLYTPGEEGGETGGGESHDHGLARWNGEASQTTFDLPDFAEAIEWLALNGLIEDPFVYSLSPDGSQVVLDTGLTSSQLVMASYIVRSL